MSLILKPHDRLSLNLTKINLRALMFYTLNFHEKLTMQLAPQNVGKMSSKKCYTNAILVSWRTDSGIAKSNYRSYERRMLPEALWKRSLAIWNPQQMSSSTLQKENNFTMCTAHVFLLASLNLFYVVISYCTPFKESTDCRNMSNAYTINKICK